MSAAIMSTNAAHRPLDPKTDAEWAIVPKHIVIYSAPYNYTELTSTFGHIAHGPISISARPSTVSTTLQRNYSLFEHETILHLEF
jgi:hypothetical protein